MNCSVSLVCTFIPDNEMWEPWFLHRRDLAGVRKRIQDNNLGNRPASQVKPSQYTQFIHWILLNQILVIIAIVVVLDTRTRCYMSFYYLTFHYAIACCANRTQDHSINEMFLACAYTHTTHSPLTLTPSIHPSWPFLYALRTCCTVIVW